MNTSPIPAAPMATVAGDPVAERPTDEHSARDFARLLGEESPSTSPPAQDDPTETTPSGHLIGLIGMFATLDPATADVSTFDAGTFDPHTFAPGTVDPHTADPTGSVADPLLSPWAGASSPLEGAPTEALSTETAAAEPVPIAADGTESAAVDGVPTEMAPTPVAPGEHTPAAMTPPAADPTAGPAAGSPAQGDTTPPTPMVRGGARAAEATPAAMPADGPDGSSGAEGATEADPSPTAFRVDSQSGPAATPAGWTVGAGTSAGTETNDAAPIGRDGAEPPMVSDDPVRPEELGGVVLRSFRRGSGVTGLTVRLDPVGLGAVRIESRWEDGVLHLRLAAESTGTVARLEETLEELRRQLLADGVEIGSLDVSTGRSSGGWGGDGAPNGGALGDGDGAGPLLGGSIRPAAGAPTSMPAGSPGASGADRAGRGLDLDL